MLPQGVVLKTDEALMYWKNGRYNITVDEAKKIAAEFFTALGQILSQGK